MMVNESRHSRAHFDLPLVIMVFAMAAFGVLSVSVATFSVSSSTEDTLLNYIVSSYYGMRQAIFLMISPIIIGVVTYVISYQFFLAYFFLYKPSDIPSSLLPEPIFLMTVLVLPVA